MGFFSKLGGYVGRGAAALATGGASEAYRAATGKTDPYTAYQQRLGGSLGGKVDDSTGGGDKTANPLDSETPEQRMARMQAQGASSVASGYRDRVLSAPDAQPRLAPLVADPTRFRAANVGAAPTIGAPPPVTAERIASTYDPSQSDATRAAQNAYIDRLHGVEAGTAPSVAVDAMRQASARNVAGAFSLAGSKGGYGGYAIRQAQRQAGAAGQQLVSQVGQERAAEAATAREQEAGMLTGMRSQDLAGAQTGASLALTAGQSNQQTGLSAGQGNQQTALEVARADQAAKLQTQLTQAGFNQDAIMKMSDQELQVHLANAGFHLSQEQIDDLRSQNQAQNRQGAINSAADAANAVANRNAQIQMARAQLQLAIQQNDQKKKDAALQMLAQLGAAYATGGSSMAVTGVPGGGGDSNYINASNSNSSNLE